MQHHRSLTLVLGSEAVDQHPTGRAGWRQIPERQQTPVAARFRRGREDPMATGGWDARTLDRLVLA